MATSVQGTTPLSTQSFLNELGVDTHIAYTDGEYSNISNVISDLKYLGINQVRDGISNGEYGSAPLASYIAMAQAGIHFTFIIEPSSTADITAKLALIDQVEKAVPGSITAIEGPNEINNQPLTFNGVSGLQGAVNAQAAIYSAVHSDANLAGVPVDYFTGYDTGSGKGPDPTTTAGLADYDTQHPYPNNGTAPAFWVNRSQALTNTTSATAPAVYTETGYTTNQVDATVQAKYSLDLLLDTASQGISKTYLYDLMDAYAPGSPQGDDGYGLFDYTKAPKPVATAIHNLTTILQDPGATAATFTPTPLNFTITGLPSTGNYTVMEKSDGTYVVEVWAEPQIWNNTTHTEIAAPSSNVTLNLAQAYSNIQVFDPLTGASSIATTSGKSVTVSVTDHPILIELSKPVAAANDTLVVNLSEDYYKGDAQVIVSVDGKQVGGVETVTAVAASHQNQDFVFTGAFGAGPHTVTVNFINDLYGGSSTQDRNIHVNAITVDGAKTVENAFQSHQGAANYTVTTPTAPAVSITSQVLSQDTGASATDRITSNGAVTLSGAASGPAGTTVQVFDGTTALGAATINPNGSWTYSTTLGAGSHALHAVATDPAGDTATTAAQPTILVETVAPTVSVTSLTQAAGSTAVNLVGEVTGSPGTVVTIYNGTVALGNATINSTGGWTYSATLAPGDYNFNVKATDLAGNVTAAPDPEFVVTNPTAGPGTLVVNLSEDAYNGDAQVIISVDGKQVGGVETITAIAANHQSQNFAFSGDFSAGPHTVSVDFINDASGSLAGQDRNVHVNSITLNGQTTVLNAFEAHQGTVNYTASAPAIAPTVAISGQVLAHDTGVSASDNITSNGAVTLTGTVSGAAGTTVEVFDGSSDLGAATLNGSGGWTYATTLGAGAHALHAVASDTTGHSASTAAAATVTVETAAPSVAISAQTLAQDTGVSASDNITSNGAVTLTGTVSGAAGTSVELFDGSTDLGAATLNGSGGWTYATTLSAGSHALHATATDLAGNAASTAPAPTITVETVAPTVTIAAPIEATDGSSVSLSGAVSGAAGTTVEIYNGSTALGAATLNGSGGWSYSGALPVGTYNFQAVATDLAGHSATATDAAFTVAAPVAAGGDTLLLNLSETAVSGKDAQFTVSVDGVQVGGVQTVTASASAGASQNFSLNGAFGAGAHTVTVNFVNGFTGSSADAGRELFVNAIAFNNSATFENGHQQFGGGASYSVTAPTTALASNAGSADTIILNLSEAAASGVDAQFMVSVDGQLVGGVQTVTASKAAGASQNFALTGDFGTGPHAVSIDFLNGFSGSQADAGRTLDVNSITVDGVATTENSALMFDGATTYTVPTAATSGSSSSGSGGLKSVGGSSGNSISSTPPSTDAVVAITSQVLAQDTGASATDNITSNGAVTLTGTVTAGAGAVVQVVDGTTVLGNATLNSNGGWTYATTLGAGSHALHAVVTDTAGDTAQSGAEPTILVETAAPSVSIAAPVQSATSTDVTLTGTISGPAGTTVEIYNGSTDLGAATLNGSGGWSYDGHLAAGAYSFQAVATDLAGNTANAADASFTIANRTAGDDIVVATVSTGTGTAQETIDLSSPTGISGTYVPTSPAGTIGASPLVTYNWDPATQLSHFLAAQAQVAAGVQGASAAIVAIGDSTTRGFGSAATGWDQLGYPAELSQALNADGVASQNDNFLGQGQGNSISTDNRVALVGGATYPWVIDAGGQVVGTTAAGQGFDFTLNTPKSYDRVTLSYVDIGSGSVTVSVDGGPVLATVQFGNTGQTLTQTIDIPAGLHSELSIRATNANPTYIEGASFSSSTSPSVQVYNAGIGGWDSGSSDTSTYNGSNLLGSTNGYGQTAGSVALSPKLALIDLGINDINSGVDTTAQTVQHISDMVAELRSVGSDVIIVIPHPFADDGYAAQLPALRAALETLSTQENVPIIDLSATYGDSEAALAAAGLMSDNLHPDATLYADIGSSIASLLTSAINSANASTVSETAAQVTTNLDTLASNTQLTQVTVSDSAAVTLNVNQLTSDQHVLGLLHNSGGALASLNVQDTAANISSVLSSLNSNGQVSKITVSDNQTLVLNAAQVSGSAHALTELTHLDGSAVTLDVADTSANLNGLTLNNFAVHGNVIDVKDLNFSALSGTFTENSAGTGGVLSLSDGVHSTAITVLGQFAPAGYAGSLAGAGFGLTFDGVNGSSVSYHG